MTLEDQIKKLNPEQLKAIMKAIDTPISTGVHSYHDKRFKKKHLRIGVIGDTHIGSKYFDQKALEIFVGVCEKENVDFYIQTGDITDGMYNNRPGHIYELTHLGYDAQLKAVTKSFPNTGKKTFFITGNHDETHIKNAGADIGFAIEKARPDMIYLGPREADLLLGHEKRTRLKLFHPGGGSAYAVSYKPQKIIESFEGGKKPEILVIGHFHKIESLFYRGVNCIQAGTFQSQSEFMRVHALAAHKAGTILDVDMINDGTVTSFKTMVVPFYE